MAASLATGSALQVAAMLLQPTKLSVTRSSSRLSSSSSHVSTAFGFESANYALVSCSLQDDVKEFAEKCVDATKRLIARRFSDPPVQADMKLWPFKVVLGPGDKPMIEVDNKRDSSDQRPPRGRPPGTSIPKQQQPMGEPQSFTTQISVRRGGVCAEHAMEDVAIRDGIPEFLQNSIILQTFGVKGKHRCQDVEHIQVPPYVAPKPIEALWAAAPLKAKRDIWVFFRGKMEIHTKNISGRVYSKGLRTVIWQKFGRNRRFYIKRTRFDRYHTEILRSVFCLCPLGWAPWSPRIVESVALGCVPVIIADNVALPYPDVVPWANISLSVPEHDVVKLGKVLERVTATNLTAIQSNLWIDRILIPA